MHIQLQKINTLPQTLLLRVARAMIFQRFERGFRQHNFAQFKHI